MPLAKPRSSENQAQFVSRCMSDDEMKKEFPDQKQRTGVCFSQWRSARGEKMESKENVKLDEQGRIIIAENVPIIINATIGVEDDS